MSLLHTTQSLGIVCILYVILVARIPTCLILIPFVRVYATISMGKGYLKVGAVVLLKYLRSPLSSPHLEATVSLKIYKDVKHKERALLTYTTTIYDVGAVTKCNSITAARVDSIAK